MATNECLGAPGLSPYTGRQFTNVGLEQLRRALCIFATERAWTEHHTPKNLLLALVKEVGQLSGIFQWRGELPPGLAGSLPQDEQQRLAQALSDVLLCLLRLADVCGVDLGRAALQKLAHNAAKYPQQQQQQQSGPLNIHSDGSASSTASSCSTNMSMPLHQQQQQHHRFSPSYEARTGSSVASSPSSAQQQQQPSAAGFICRLPASPRQQQLLLQPASLPCGSPNLAEGIIGYERASRSPSPMAAAAAAVGSPPRHLSPCSLASMMQLATAAMPSVSMPTKAQAKQQQQQQQQQLELKGVSGVTVSTGSRFTPTSSTSDSSKAPAADDEDALHSSKVAGLLPQGLLDEIGHCLQLGPAAAAAAAAAADSGDEASSNADCQHAGCSSVAGGGGGHHTRVVSIGECITPPLHFSPCVSRNTSTAAPLTSPGAAASRSDTLSNSSSAGSSNSSTNAAAAAAVSAAAAAASAAAAGSAAASLWLTAEEGASALSAALPSQQDSAATLPSCSTSQLSWGIFSASSAEQSGAASSHADESELESERSSTPPLGGSNPTSCGTGIGHEQNLQQPMLLGGTRTGSGGLSPALGFAGLFHSPQQQHSQRQQHAAFGSPCSGSIGSIPVRSLAAAAAAAAAASGIAPVDIDAASAVQQLAAGLLPLDVGGFQLCPRCGRLHSGSCEAARRTQCPRCYRKAHLGECWSRCISCNLVHAAGKCRAGGSSGGLSRGRRDQQQPVQRQQQRDTSAADEDLESFPSLSEGMAGSGAPAAAAAAQPAPASVQLDFSPRIGR